VVRSSAGAEHPFTLSPATTAAVRALAGEHRATTFMVLTAAVAAVLAGYSGQRDLAVGTASAGRVTRELERLVGFMTNTLVLRCRVQPRMSFGELLDQVRETTLEAFAHEEVPFERLVEVVAPERDTGRTPLIEAMVVLQNAATDPLDLPGVVTRPHPVARPAAPFDLGFEFHESDEELHGRVVYGTALFDPATIVRLAGHLTAVLDAAAASPGRPVATLPMAGPAELTGCCTSGTTPTGRCPTPPCRRCSPRWWPAHRTRSRSPPTPAR
jgi:non-ribosomal peptide synthetase component F